MTLGPVPREQPFLLQGRNTPSMPWQEFFERLKRQVSTLVSEDHGDLNGLLDDDHTQYLLINGVRAMTGDLNLGNNDITNISSINVGATTTISGILDEDNLASNSNTSLATQQSIKAYVDTQLTAEDLDFAGDSGTGSVDLDSQTLTIAGTASEIETSASGQTITIGLPDNVSIVGTLGAGGLITASAGLTTAGGNVTLGAGDDVIGSTTTDVNIGSGNFTVAGATGNTAVGGTLTMTGASNDFELSLSTTILNLQSKTPSFPNRVRLFTHDGDGTDDLKFYLYGVGTPVSVTNSEYMEMAWAESPAYYIIHSFATGTGTTRPIHLYTGINSEQLVLNTDGSTDVGGRLILHNEFGWDEEAETDLGAGHADATTAAANRDDIGGKKVIIVKPVDTGNDQYFGFTNITNRSEIVVINEGCVDAYIISDSGTAVIAQMAINFRVGFSYKTSPGYGLSPSRNDLAP